VGSIGGQAALIANGAGKVVLDTANLEIYGTLIENTVVMLILPSLEQA
jgi:hypothetical protein